MEQLQEFGSIELRTEPAQERQDHPGLNLMADSLGEPLPFGGHVLQDGAILASLAHACFIVAKPVLSNEQYWAGRNYCVEDSAGSFGTVTFDSDKVVGAFFSAGSERNPFKSDQDYDL